MEHLGKRSFSGQPSPQSVILAPPISDPSHGHAQLWVTRGGHGAGLPSEFQLCFLGDLLDPVTCSDLCLYRMGPPR